MPVVHPCSTWMYTLLCGPAPPLAAYGAHADRLASTSTSSVPSLYAPARSLASDVGSVGTSGTYTSALLRETYYAVRLMVGFKPETIAKCKPHELADLEPLPRTSMTEDGLQALQTMHKVSTSRPLVSRPRDIAQILNRGDCAQERI